MGCGDLEASLPGTEEHERYQELRGQRIKQARTVLNIQAQRRIKVQRNHEAGIGVEKQAELCSITSLNLSHKNSFYWA